MYQAYNTGDRTTALACLDPDVTWDFTEVPDGVVYTGHQEVERFWAMLDDVWESIRIDVVAQGERGDAVVNDVRVVARGKGSGVDVEHSETHVWQVRDGKLAECKTYLDRVRALNG
jgi:ketosteroid isomerase-like protein